MSEPAPGATATTSGSTGDDVMPNDTGGNDTAVVTGEQTSGETDDSMSTTGTTGTGAATGTTSTTSTTSTSGLTGGGPVPNGGACLANNECMSGSCFLIVALGGSCGDCLGDDDCAGGGCSPPNPLAMPPQGATCNIGGLGDGCETAAVCVDPAHVCALIIDVPGVLQSSSCSECETNADCAGNLVCNLSVDIGNLSGEKTCVPPGSVPNAAFCDIAGAGGQACASGYCASGSLSGLVEFGVCSPCQGTGIASVGCAPGDVCVPPEIGFDNSVTAAMCVPA